MGCSSSHQQQDIIAYIQKKMPEALIHIDQQPNFYIIQYFTSCLSEMAYYIESDKEALIIDPMREIEPYLELLKERQTKVKYIFETHFHADFVSGHIELSKKTGAQIIYGPGAKAQYDIVSAQDNQIFQLGKIQIKVLHTPGHTLESSSFLLLDENQKEYCIFTGDTLFLGEVGRPDLAVKGNEITSENLAEFLYDSLRTKIMTLNPQCIVYPGHGSGSACGKKIQTGNSDTIENQLITNYALDKNLKKEDFVKILTDNIPPPPQYFFHSASVNKNGYQPVEKIIEQSLVFYNVQQFLQIQKEKNAVILDTRSPQEFLSGFIPSSVNVSLSMNFAVQVGSLFPPSTKFLLVTDGSSEKQAIIRLARIGYENVLGCLNQGFSTYSNSGEKIDSIKSVQANLVNDNLMFLDVRGKSEAIEGRVSNSLNVPLPELEKALLNKQFKVPDNEEFYVYCRSGGRSSIACSILKKLGVNNLVNVQGGFDALKNNSAIKTQSG